MRVFITGITGFTGRHMVGYLLDKGCHVHGIHSGQSALEKLPTHDRISSTTCDIRDISGLNTIFKEFKPEVVFHFAAKTKIKNSLSDLLDAYETNTIGTINLMESILANNLNPRILVPGSSAEFGLVTADENPINESSPHRPMSPYAVSKITQNMTAFQYHLVHDLKIIRTHTFNFLGPGQSSSFVCSAFARQVAEIEKGIKPGIMVVGNLESFRDFTDVRDGVDAYWKVVNYGVSGQVYNICSGQSVSIGDILDSLLKLTHMDIQIKQSPHEPKKFDVPYQTGDFTKLNNLCGWHPRISVKTSLQDMLDYWRKTLIKKQTGENK